ncbi:MAG: hypothetical protein AAB421_02105 [Patescibacteria group bacterium]
MVMKKIGEGISALIIPWPVLALTLMVTIVIAGFQAMFHDVGLRDRTAKTEICTVSGPKATSSDRIRLYFACGGRELSTDSAEVIVSYLKNPGPLTCKTYSGGLIECDQRS